jgi:isopentenyl-diphosphate delta-isomerase
MTNDLIRARKGDHIRINLEEDVLSHLKNGFEQFRFIHEALPELDFNKIDSTQELFGKKIILPFLVSSMTGGTEQAAEINKALAIISQKYGMVMGVGSQRAAIQNPVLSETFQIRKFAPDILLFANLGAVQLNYGFGIEECKQAVDMISADGLILHLNPLQEAVQPEGDVNFTGLLQKIEYIVGRLHIPVIVKEVGWGISAKTAFMLQEAGVAAIDVAGAGGTSWSQVERFRLKDPISIRVAEEFVDWGIPTAQALVQICSAMPDYTVFASGGLKTPMDVAKSIAMGAKLAGMASVFLKAAVVSMDSLEDMVELYARVLRIAMFSTGSKNLVEFRNQHIQRIGE